MVVVWSSSWPSREKRWPELLLLVTRKLAKMSTGTIVDRIDPFAKRSLKKAGDDGWVQLLILNCWTTFTLFTVCIFFWQYSNMPTIQYLTFSLSGPSSNDNIPKCFNILLSLSVPPLQLSGPSSNDNIPKCFNILLSLSVPPLSPLQLSGPSSNDNIPKCFNIYYFHCLCLLYKAIFQQAYNIFPFSLSVPSSIWQYSNKPTIFHSVHYLCYPQ